MSSETQHSDGGSLGLLGFLQLMDSSFPSGSYAHSFGLEWLQQQDDFELEPFLDVRLHECLARLELPIARAAYEANDVVELENLDGLMDVLTPAAELRQASRSVGHSFLRAAVKLRPDGLPAEAAVRGVEHHPVAYGAVLRAWRLPLKDGLAAYAFQSLRQQLMALQRLGRIGQSIVQEVLYRVRRDVPGAVASSLRVPLEETGTFAPWLDLAGMSHEHQFARLFLS